MGGLIGMIGRGRQSPIRRLVLNDVGPIVTKEGLERIRDYLEMDWQFQTADEAEAHIRAVYAPFGPWTMTSGAYLRAQHAVRRRRRLADEFRSGDCGTDERGARRGCGHVAPVRPDHLPCADRTRRAIGHPDGGRRPAEMTTRGPRADLIEFPECGHAPTLMPAQQIAGSVSG